ncbi:MAG: hypothetical protein ACE5R4_03195 [Armatimonadota bacterium]
MKRCGCWLATVFAACLASAWGQPNATGPHIGYVYPAGGQQGTTFRAAVGGQFLRGADDAYVSGEGVRASVVEYGRPLDNMELGRVSRFLRELVKRRWSARVMEAAAKEAADMPPVPDHPWLRDLDHKSAGELARLRTKLFDPKKQPNAQIAEQVEIEVIIDAEAPPGHRELRLATPAGLTNPLRFQVGTLPEVCEERLVASGEHATPVVDLPVVLNGQITPGEVDRFGLRARKGQQLVIRMQARELIPYLADAVPGWFQATMALHAPNGSEVAYDDDYRFDPDPVLFYIVPADGVYELEVRDALYRGRDDFVYRIAVGELPFITRMFPLGGRAGAPTVASLVGWNLPTEALHLDTEPGGGAIRWVAVGQDRGLCNQVPYAVDALPECTETEPNDAPGTAQKVTLPLIVNGRIGRLGDVDRFRFDGQAGQEVVAEVYARRLNSPLDSALRLVDSTGGVVAWNDDHEDDSAGLVTHQADSYLRVRLPQDGDYCVCLSDAQHQGGDAHGYRLRIGPARPDFAVRLTPSSVNVARGRSASVTVHVVRKDGFDGDIDLVLRDAPVGFALSEARVPSDKDSVQMTLSAPRDAPRQPFPLRLEARARIGGVTVSRPVVPAEDMMQAFLYRHLVPQQELLVALARPRPVPTVWRPLVPGMRVVSATPLLIPLGGTAPVQIQAPQVLPDRRRSALQMVRFRLSDPPRGVTLHETAVVPTGVTLTLKADANMALAGDAANLMVEAFTELEGAEPGGQSAARSQRVSLGVLPAIPFEIVRP